MSTEDVLQDSPGFAALMEGWGNMIASRPKPHHMKASLATMRAMPQRQTEPGPVTHFGMPIYSDESLPLGKWLIGEGRYPEATTKYRELSDVID